jgi:hypothetical protein
MSNRWAEQEELAPAPATCERKVGELLLSTALGVVP